MLQTRQLSLPPPPSSILPLFFPLLNNEGWLVLIVMQAVNFLASFQVARAYSVRDLKSWRNFPFRRAQYGKLRTFGRLPIWDVLPFWIWYYERLSASLFANLIAPRTRVHWP